MNPMKNLILALVLVSPAMSGFAAPAAKPNLLFILADDLG